MAPAQSRQRVAVSKSIATKVLMIKFSDMRRSNPRLATAWAKSPNRRGAGGSGWLSLVDHSIDVTAVAEALLRLPTIRARFDELAERVLSDIDVARLCFFIGIHDAGKVNHGFQAKLRNENRRSGHIGPLWAILCHTHFDLATRKMRRALRKALMAVRWKSWFKDQEAERGFWGVILAHHGSLPIEPPQARPSLWHPRDDYDPISALEGLAKVVSRMTPDAFCDDDRKLPDPTRFQHAFAGFVTLADWLGSDDTVFRFPNSGAPSGSERIAWARHHAADLLNRRGIDPIDARGAAKQQVDDFVALFPGLSKARPAQAELLRAPLPKPGQVIVLEAETGSGKTEAALIHFLRLFRAGEVDGLYFALPTRAAAVQIHERITDMITRWLGPAAPPVGLAVPGYLRVDEAEGTRLPDEYGVLWPDEVQDRGWAVENSKRYLSGAVMVGTVDQMLLGGLRVRHAPFRSGPMLRLLLCVDEVHASDAYMTTLLRNVLNQHTAAGGHALLMSATLGSLARMRLLSDRVERRLEPEASSAALLPYPSLQRSGDSSPKLLPGEGGRRKKVTVELLDPKADDHRLSMDLKAAAEDGAVLLFIRNRVGDAVDTVRRLEEIGAPLLRCQGVTAPHHGRFAPEDRRLLDAALEQAFQKRRGVIAVTTQTAEQSLDIDADWLITDIAPGDVFLQRIGRLHRHDRPRPTGSKRARVSVLAPTPEQLVRTLNHQGMVCRRTILGLGGVYENIVGVLSTRKWLEEHREIRIPEHNRALVEAATHRCVLSDLAEDLGEPWKLHLQDVEGKTAANSGAARIVCIDWDAPLTDNQPIPHLDHRPATRLGIKDRRVHLPRAMKGPFGRPVRTLNIPGWMVPDEGSDADVSNVVSEGGEIRFRLGSREYRYNRFGLSTS